MLSPNFVSKDNLVQATGPRVLTTYGPRVLALPISICTLLHASSISAGRTPLPLLDTPPWLGLLDIVL